MAARVSRADVIGAAIVVAVACVVFLPLLSQGGLHSTEGHRAIPGFTMLETGDWLVTEMFEQPYLRKPPGLPWAIAACGAVLGQNELAARLPSAVCSIAMVLVAFVFTRRWFGRRGAIAAGLSQALLPWLWSTGRAAEIEAMNNLGSQLATLSIIALLAAPRSRSLAATVTLAAGLAIAGLAKGPAAALALLGAIAAPLVVRRSVAPLANPRLWIGLLAGAVPVAITLGLIAWRVSSEDLQPVTQLPNAFLFEPGQILDAALLPLSVIIAAFPLSLALLFPWGPDATRELSCNGAPRAPLLIARSLTWAFLLSLVISALVGISNPRYAQPAVPLLAPLVGYAVWAMPRVMMPKRRAIARACLLGHPLAWPALLLIFVLPLYHLVYEQPRRATSGREAGLELAEVLGTDPTPRTIAADGVIEARPETLWYAERALSGAVRDAGVRFVWVPRWNAEQGTTMGLATSLPNGLVVRTDEQTPEGVETLPEWAAFGARPNNERWTRNVHKYRFAIYLQPVYPGEESFTE